MRDISTIVQRHNLTWQGPNPDFFEGMLLGNGDIGVCVTVRPDGVVLHLGKNTFNDSSGSGREGLRAALWT